MRRETPVLPREWIERIWQRLENSYGTEWRNKWRADAKENAMAEWAAQLGELHDFQIAWALDNLPDRSPSLPVFKRIALEAPAPQESAVLTYSPPDNTPRTHAQKARAYAFCSIAQRAMGREKQAERAATLAAVEIEKARDAGEYTPIDIFAECEIEIAEVRDKRLRKESIRITVAQPPGGWQFDLDAIKRRQGTPAEKPRDWARIIAARVERGDKTVLDYARKKAREALRGIEKETWLDTDRQIEIQPPPPATAECARAYDEVEALPW